MGQPGGSQLPTPRPGSKVSTTRRGERSRRRIGPRKPRQATADARLPRTRRLPAGSRGSSTEPLTQAASSGASSSRVTRDNPSFVSTRFSAATETLLGAVISMPIG